MKTLIQTGICSIVYGELHGKPNQELFRCTRQLDDIDLRRYINEQRCVLGMEPDEEVKNLEDLKTNAAYLGYYRMYFRNGSWNGRWMESDKRINQTVCHGVDEIINWLTNEFPKGCNWTMENYLAKFPLWNDSHNRYLLKPFMSSHYKIMFDTTYGNQDYPVRIYVFE